MLNTDDIRLAEVKMLSKKLAPLSAQLQVVEHEDSVQRIAALPPDQREAFLENLLAMYQREEELGSFSSAADDAFFFRNLSSEVNQTTDDQGNWYFYNQTMVSLGKMEFEKRWGRRSLADDWRRLDKKAISAEPENQGPVTGPTDPFSPEGGPGAPPKAETGPEKAPGALPDMNSLLEGLPLTPEKMEASHQRLEEAIYGAGMIFYEQLDRYSESREMLTELLLEYPETEHRKQALMTLFLACQQMENGPCMVQRKQEYLSEFPDTPFGEYLRDPDFLEKQKALEEKMNQNYREAYRSYKVGDWSRAITQTLEVKESRFEPLKPKASLLMAMAYGRKGEAKLFEAGLSEVVANYQGSPEALLAGEWLSMLNEGRRPVKLESGYAQEAPKDAGVEEATTSGTVAEQEGFIMEPDSVHFLLIAVNNDANINQLMFNVADYNFEHFLIGDYQLKTDRLADGRRMLKVGPFPNKNIGMDYYFSVRDNTALFKGSRAGGTTLLLISANNLKPLLLSSDILGYQGFFLKQYLAGSEVSAVVISEREVPAEEVIAEEVTVEEAVAYSMSDGPMLGMVVIPSNSGNKKRAMQFLPNYVRNIISVSVSVSEEQLADGTDVLLIDGFPVLTEFGKLKEALAKNPYWKGQLAGADWQVCPVSVESLKQIREQGNVKDYLKFVEDELGK
jgi:outer membrane protein assembly factor BamD (BamD/ComL family)